MYDETYNINPKDETGWINKGLYLENQGRYEKALFCFDEALKDNANNYMIWYYKGISLKNLYRYDEAVVCFERIS